MSGTKASFVRSSRFARSTKIKQNNDQEKSRGFLNMNQLAQSLKREGSSRFVFLSRGRAFLTRPSIAVWAPLPLRLIVGYGFMEHGLAKLSRGPEAFAAILHAIGVPAPHLMAWLTILIEIIGGFAVLLGAFVPLVSLPMAAVLFVAMLTVHLPYGFSSIKLLSVTSGRAQFRPPGYELDLFYLACLATLVFGGSGPIAIDRYLRKK
jgi:putative oxidoreductase